jgi:preprotein translocase subunit SecD
MTVPPSSKNTETRLIAALTDTARRNLPDATMPPPFRSPVSSENAPRRPLGRIGPWTVPALVAAVVVALTIGALALPNRGQQRSVPPAGKAPATFVTLRARSEGLSAAELEKARQIIIARAAGLGAANADVQIVGTDEITAYLPGVAAADVGALVAADALLFRPLIIDPVSAPAPGTPTAGTSTAAPSTAVPGAARLVDQWKSLGFAPPKDATAFNALSPSQQGAVRAVVSGWNCGSRPLDRVDAPIVACDQERTAKYLLGPAIFPSDQVRSARASAPIPGAPEWQVIVSLTASGQRQWASYTAQHNLAVHPVDMANQVADTVNSQVVVASTIQSTINGDTAIAGNFTQRSATMLAASLNGGALPAPFDVISIQRR